MCILWADSGTGYCIVSADPASLMYVKRSRGAAPIGVEKANEVATTAVKLNNRYALHSSLAHLPCIRYPDNLCVVRLALGLYIWLGLYYMSSPTWPDELTISLLSTDMRSLCSNGHLRISMWRGADLIGSVNFALADILRSAISGRDYAFLDTLLDIGEVIA
jgi:hypothetical protein